MMISGRLHLLAGPVGEPGLVDLVCSHSKHGLQFGFAPWTGGCYVKLLVTGAAPPASHNPNLEPLVEGPAISMAAPTRRSAVRGTRRGGYHRIATTVAIAPASMVASPERSTLSRAKCQRVATPPPPVANPDSLGLIS